MLFTTAIVSALSIAASAAPATKYDWDCSSGRYPGAFVNHTYWWAPNSGWFGTELHGPPMDNTCGIYFVPVKNEFGWDIAKTFYADGRPYP